uniref:Ribosomal RNA-processing protein 8 n=1 Tax=Albugo laibachii Nc14 TaxID=890382 RepID=F0WQC5_9STRA|nr:ribosomal RNAprocessing protein putative [Albugo laibachii Nc14]|eukprot:CCA23533.1 ribosomal RNAprocessing protein putative [Albugo laibachii Nc14]
MGKRRPRPSKQISKQSISGQNNSKKVQSKRKAKGKCEGTCTASIEKETGTEESKKSSLTKLQQAMRKRLDGSRFRMLNEELYTKTGHDAFQTFQNDPDLFDIYHQGFREQVTVWPINPLDIFIEYIKKRPDKVVADFGCGEARLAQSVSNTVHSYDLVARNAHTIACNIAHVPLGSNSIDIAIYCLALMGTTIPEYLREAHRVLRAGGILKIAEVKSRFETKQLGGIQGFISELKKLGFDILQKDERNKMFVLLEFQKSMRKSDKNVRIELKACEYKRR